MGYLSDIAQNLVKYFNTPRQVTGSNFKPLIQTPLQNVQPINYPQVIQQAYKTVAPIAQQAQNFYQQTVVPKLRTLSQQPLPINNPTPFKLQMPTIGQTYNAVIDPMFPGIKPLLKGDIQGYGNMVKSNLQKQDQIKTQAWLATQKRMKGIPLTPQDDLAIKNANDLYLNMVIGLINPESGIVKKKAAEELTALRPNVKRGSFTNVRNIDDRLAPVSGQVPSKPFVPNEPLGRTIGVDELKALRANPENTKWMNEPLPWESETSKPLTQTTSRNMEAASQKEQVFKDFIMKDEGTPLAKKINFFDYLRTPDRVLEKIGLGDEAKFLRTSYESYQSQLPKELEIITQWAKRVPKEENQTLFRYLNGDTNLKNLSPEAQKVAGEIKAYLADWADKLKLPEDKRITSYITHVFPKGAVEKEFPEDIANIISDKVAKSTYDPFVTQRMGKLGFIEDTWKALDYYLKRATRKFNMDPALEKISAASGNLEKSQFTWVKNYVDRVNMRPTAIDNMLDTTIKQIAGYRFGVRPTTTISRWIRQMVYRGTLGFNIGSALKNLTQGVNTYSKLGERYTITGYAKMFTNWKASIKELEATGILKDEFIQDRTISATKKFWQKVDENGFYLLFNTAEKINRGAAYFGAKSKALNEGMSPIKAVEYAKKIVRDTQFTFGVDTPLVLESDIAKTVLQFQSFNVKQAEMLIEMIKDKKYAQLVRYTIGSIVVANTVGKLFGMEPVDFIPFYAIIKGTSKLGQTPAIKLGQDLFATKGYYGQDMTWKDKANMIGNDLIPFVPGGVQLNKTLGGLQDVNRGYATTDYGIERITNPLFNGKESNIKYPIKTNLQNYLKAATLGSSNLPEAQQYKSSNASSLGAKQSELIKQSPDRFTDYQKILQTRKDDAVIIQAKDIIKSSGTNSWVNTSSGAVYLYLGDDGAVRSIKNDFVVPEPELSGQTELDKKIISKYKSAVTSKQTDVAELYSQGQITADEAEKLLGQLEQQKSLLATAKKPKKIAGIKNITFKTTKIANLKTKAPKKATIKLAKNVIKVSKPKKLVAYKVKKTPVKITKTNSLSDIGKNLFA